MRGATECAKRLKSYFAGLRSKLGKVRPPSPTDPITELLLGVLSRDVPESRAAEGLERLRAIVVDYNELRVIPPIELADLLHDFPDARLKCEDISRALNAIFAIEHTVSLDRVAELPKKDMLAYLGRLDGLEAYTRARIRLLGFQQHAIPLDEVMWAVARTEQFVDARCPHDEAQQFLERQISEGDALEFFALLKRQAWSEQAALAKAGAIERIQSVPPDRTTRNMLLMLTGGPSLLDAVEADDDEVPPEDAAAAGIEALPATRKSRGRRGKAGPAGDGTPTAPRPRKSARQPTPAEGKPAVKAKRPPRETSKSREPAKATDPAKKTAESRRPRAPKAKPSARKSARKPAASRPARPPKKAAAGKRTKPSKARAS